VAEALGLLARARSRLLGALALYLAQPVKTDNASASADPQSLLSTLLPGDVLLTDGNTRAAAIVRRVTRSMWSHVSMYVGPLEDGADPRCIVEADVAAGVRSVRLSELKGLHIRVLRPRDVDASERRRLAAWVVSRIGDEYDLAHAWALGTKLLRLPLASRFAPAPAALAESATRFICSSLLAHAFALIGLPLFADYRFVTPRDFESASAFEVVRSSI
jgi:Permuted papain-like amidase enzyme, YaeF/YiiX, C92 family